jgi:hypothetical protein
MAAYIPYLTALTDTDGPITIDGVDYDGRLYNLSNSVPAGHHTAGITAGEAVKKLNAAGSPAANGLIGWLGLGMSNARRLLAELLPLMTSKQDAVVSANAAQTNHDLNFMIDNEATYYAEVDAELADRGLTPEQVGVVLLYTAIAGPTGSVADYIAETKSKLKAVIVDQITVRYPNCKQIYLVSREYGGWTSSGNPEPYAFAQAIAIRELVLDQVNHATTGDPDLDYSAVPWLGWTTNLYTWANGLGSDEAEGGTPGRADGLEWLESDFESGGLHQTEVGATKEAELILPEFESGPYAAPWWYADLEPTIIASHKDTDGDATVTVPSYTPATDVHQLIIISNRAAAAATAEQPVPTGHSATYALEETITYPASNRNRLSVFRGIGTGIAGTLGVAFNTQNQASVHVVVIETPDLYTGGTAAALSVIESVPGSAIADTDLEIATTTSTNVALMIAAFANSGGFAVNEQTGFDEIYDDSAGASNGLEIQTLIGHSSPAKGTKAAGGTFDVAGILITLRLPPPEYLLEVEVTGQGTVTSSPAGIDCGDVCDYEFYEDTEVALTAAPAYGWEFVGWSGDTDSVDGNTCTVTMAAAAEITAEFRIAPGIGVVTGGVARLLIGDRYGRILAELDVQPGPVSWRLNQVGRMTLPIGRTDAKAREDYLRFGNRVLIQFDNGLPNWGGVIEPPRDWQRDVITATVYGAEYLFGFRQTDRGRYFNNATVGHIFERLIVEANQVYGLGIELGYIWGGGSGHWPEYHFDNLLEIFQRSLCGRLSDADFDVLASERAGYIVFTANLYERRGSDKPGVVLLEDVNLAKIRLLEQGSIVNEWHIIGEGTTWGEGRPVAPAHDTESIALYGLRQGSEVYPNTSQVATLQATADAKLAASKKPRNKWELEAANLAPARFADYDYGDSVRLLAHSFGFGGSDVMVTVETREYQPDRTCKLVVEEVA